MLYNPRISFWTMTLRHWSLAADLRALLGLLLVIFFLFGPFQAPAAFWWSQQTPPLQTELALEESGEVK